MTKVSWSGILDPRGMNYSEEFLKTFHEPFEQKEIPLNFDFYFQTSVLAIQGTRKFSKDLLARTAPASIMAPTVNLFLMVKTVSRNLSHNGFSFSMTYFICITF